MTGFYSLWWLRWSSISAECLLGPFLGWEMTSPLYFYFDEFAGSAPVWLIYDLYAHMLSPEDLWCLPPLSWHATTWEVPRSHAASLTTGNIFLQSTDKNITSATHWTWKLILFLSELPLSPHFHTESSFSFVHTVHPILCYGFQNIFFYKELRVKGSLNI